MDDEPMYNGSLTIKNSVKEWTNGSFCVVDSYYKVCQAPSDGMIKKYLSTLESSFLYPAVLIEK